MKKYLSLLLSLLLINTVIKAQNEAQKLTIPSTPAFSILNYEPTSVMKPTSNKDLAADVLNSFDKNGKLLMNLGLEASPYWLQSKPYLTSKQYLNPDIGQAFLQSFSISAATVKDSASGNNKLGGGFRFKVINGKPVEGFAIARERYLQSHAIRAIIALERNFINTTSTKESVTDSIIANLKKENTKYSNELIENIRTMANSIVLEHKSDSIKIFIEELIEQVKIADSNIVKDFATISKQREGFILEFAGASAFNMSNKNEVERVGIWANASYYTSATDLFTFTLRGMFQNRDTFTTNADFGLSYLKKGDRYNVSIEGMARYYKMKIPVGTLFDEEEDFTYRLAFQGSYLISKELSINLSFGKDFSNTSITGSGYFSILGFNYSIFNSEKVGISNDNSD